MRCSPPQHVSFGSALSIRVLLVKFEYQNGKLWLSVMVENTTWTRHVLSPTTCLVWICYPRGGSRHVSCFSTSNIWYKNSTYIYVWECWNYWRWLKTTWMGHAHPWYVSLRSALVEASPRVLFVYSKDWKRETIHLQTFWIYWEWLRATWIRCAHPHPIETKCHPWSRSSGFGFCLHNIAK